MPPRQPIRAPIAEPSIPCRGVAMNASHATELDALAGTADGVFRRLHPFVETYTRSERDDVAGALLEAERQLRSAVRSIERASRLLR